MRPCGQRLWIQARERQHRVALRELMNGGGAELVRLRHGTGGIVRGRQVVAGEIRLLRLMPRVGHSRRNPIFHLRCRIVGEGMAEILYDVKTICAAQHAQPDYVVSRVEQVRTMVWGEHQVPLRLFRVKIERYIFPFLIELQLRGGCEAFDQRRFTIKLVRKLLRFNHDLSVNPSSLRKSLVES